MNTWITRNGFLSDDEMKSNARLVWERLSEEGFSDNAIAGILGNMECESTINPGIWEGFQPYIGGYGLVQWTPYEKYSDWAGEDWQNNGDKECQRIAYEFREGIQYYSTVEFPISASEFRSSSASPEELAGAWMYNYERPWSYDTEWYRAERARYWYDLIPSFREASKEDPKPEAPKTGKAVGRAWLLSSRD